MNKLLSIAVTAGVVVVAVAPAAARDGCGRGFFRGPHGHCRPMDGPGYGPAVVAPGLVIGRFYPERGYWDGHRFYHSRYRDHGGWRYR